MVADKNWLLAEFKGTYSCASPTGIKGQKIEKPFHVKVEMKKDFLNHPGPTGMVSLCGPFVTYHKQELKQIHPDLIDTYMFELIEATELDGTKINRPECLSYEDLKDYITEKEYPINTSLYSRTDLRHAVRLYEHDEKGQQKLQGDIEKVRGGVLRISNEIAKRGAKMQSLLPSTTQIAPLMNPTKVKQKKAELIDDFFDASNQ